MKDVIKLLIDLLNGRFGDGQSMTEADWQQVIGEAQRHRVSPFLWYMLYTASDRPPLPPDIQKTLRANYYTAIAHFVRREHELKKVLEALASARVPVVLLKGAAVAYSVYPDPGMRTMCDVDLWIPQTQHIPAREALQAIGYAVDRQECHRPQALQDAFAGETRMVRGKSWKGLIELHWIVYPGEWQRHTTRIDEAGIWARSVPIENTNMRRLAAEDLVLHACVHLAVKHLMDDGAMRTMLDIALARRKLKIDWEVLVQRAKEWRVATAVWLVLSMVSELFDEPEAQLPLRTITPSRFRQRVLRWFVPGIQPSGSPMLSAGSLRFIYKLWLTDRPVDVIRLLWRGFFPDRRWLILRYELQDAPAWRIWLQLLLHPLRIALQKKI